MAAVLALPPIYRGPHQHQQGGITMAAKGGGHQGRRPQDRHAHSKELPVTLCNSPDVKRYKLAKVSETANCQMMMKLP